MKTRRTISVLSALMILWCGQVYGRGQSAAGVEAREESSPRLYPSSFTPSGSAANEYREKLDYFVANFIKYFTDRGEASKILGYDTPVKVRASMTDGAGQQTGFAAWKELYGETPEMNRYLDVYKRAFNVEVSYKFASSEYTQQLRLDMAANDLPDIFGVPSRQDMFEMAQAGVIQDLGALRGNYSSQIVEELWNGTPNIDMATFDGKLYGLPQTWPATDPLGYLYIRGDWLKALNLQPPKTMDELVKIAEAFVNADFDRNGVKDTIGMAFNKSIFSHNYRGLFTGFNVYPEYWVNKNGVLSWGGIDENNKKALAFLNDLYKRGLIDREFISYGGSETTEAIVSGKCGIMYTWHGAPTSWMELVSKEPQADFWAVPLPTVDGKPAKSPIAPYAVGYTVVNSKFANPEIAFKMFNLFVFCYNGRDGTWWGFNPPAGGSNANELSHFARIYPSLLNYDAYESLKRSYEAGWDPSLINAAADLYWGPMQNLDTKWGWDRLASPEMPYSAFRQLKEIIDSGAYFYDAFNGIPSTYMQDRWQAILDEQIVTFTKIITGDLDVNTGFDAWVRTFNSMGGDRITREVNDWYKSTTTR